MRIAQAFMYILFVFIIGIPKLCIFSTNDYTYYMKKVSKISEILSQLMFEHKLKITELARRVDLPQPTVHRIVNGTSPNPHHTSVKRLADYFDITIAQLRGEEPLESLQSTPDGWTHVKFWPTDSIAERTLTDVSISENSFAIYVNDSSMEPLFPREALLIVDGDKLANDRDYLIVKLHKSETPLFRQLIVDGNVHYIKSLNPDLEQKLFPLTDKDEILGVVVQSRIDWA
tara:strand:- start:7264 stop:7953 length:690 start_codon:yes stop_codon:yes gene_type:complete